jgi:predicted Rossmann fold nucleotide-binding protein DprA/Smf involved in DNA uptake
MSHDVFYSVVESWSTGKGFYADAAVPGDKQARINLGDHQQRRIPLMDIRATIGQLTAERDKLDQAIQALQALEESSGPAPRATTPRVTRRRRTRRTAATNGASAASRMLTPEKVVSLLTTDGVAASEVRGQTGGSAEAVLRVLKQLESDGAVKRTGARRSTKWHLTGK